ncbi:hypothetical protein KOR42_23520 [Thalassoglobus neptunius]|uniref:Uncharacterized protein n=1 Tax=Thalassoglobus neptunius TaxID=1938619 RepID=A0A5C5X9W0_9PLAN|nr:hypothetical protein KOR42_23520 [Thalassoglobus neptunius]
MNIEEGKVRKGGQNKSLKSSKRPKKPGGSGQDSESSNWPPSLENSQLLAGKGSQFTDSDVISALQFVVSLQRDSNRDLLKRLKCWIQSKCECGGLSPGERDGAGIVVTKIEMMLEELDQ